MMMKIRIGIFAVGAIIFGFGTLFHFQGYGVIGPESSFMYSNPEWITYGQVISILGIAVMGIAIFLKFSKKSNQSLEE